MMAALSDGVHIRAKQYRLGWAKISLEHLTFPESLDGHRLAPFQPENVERLLNVFKFIGIDQANPAHHIKAVVDKATLGRAGAFASAVSDVVPELQLPRDVEVRCLHGRHRIAAARAFLQEQDRRWWILEVYGAGKYLPLDIQLAFANEHPRAQSINEGYIFQSLRRGHNEEERDRWLGELTLTGRKDYRALLKEHRKPLLEALDGLLPFRGLWGPFTFGIIQRLLWINCIPELVNALCHVKRVWSDITLHVADLASIVDERTVERLEQLCPCYSWEDCNRIRRLMDGREIFPGLTDVAKRKEVLASILKTQSRIPSLYTFIRDSIQLNHVARVVKKIWPPERGQIMSKARAEYQGQSFEQDYTKVWIFAWRNFTELGGSAAKRTRGEPKQHISGENRFLWREFALHVGDLSFRTPYVPESVDNGPFHDTARQLVEARKQGKHQGEQDVVESISLFLERLVFPDETLVLPSLSDDKNDLRMNVRSGRPRVSTFEHDRCHFYFDKIYAEPASSPGRHVTSLAILFDIFKSFFPLQPLKSESQPRLTLPVVRQNDIDLEHRHASAQDLGSAGAANDARSESEYSDRVKEQVESPDPETKPTIKSMDVEALNVPDELGASRRRWAKRLAFFAETLDGSNILIVDNEKGRLWNAHANHLPTLLTQFEQNGLKLYTVRDNRFIQIRRNDPAAGADHVLFVAKSAVFITKSLPEADHVTSPTDLSFVHRLAEVLAGTHFRTLHGNFEPPTEIAPITFAQFYPGSKYF